MGSVFWRAFFDAAEMVALFVCVVICLAVIWSIVAAPPLIAYTYFFGGCG